ncbi:MAG TPA: lytic transglycosylase domain-containing protein [Roseomonas sp.]
MAFVALAGLPCWLALPQAAIAQRANQTTADRQVRPQDLPRGAATIPFREGAPPVAGLPQPLPEATAARLRRIFDFQARGEDARAIREQARLSDRRLLGHVLAHRWLRDGAENPGLDALRGWLAQYGDQPDAPEIHALLVRTAGPDDAVPPAPVVRALSPDAEAVPVARPAQPPRPAAPAMARRVDAAASAFRAGRDAEALALATTLTRAGDPAGRAGYVAGLAAWGLGDFAQALPLFQAAAEAGDATPDQRAAAAFWAARAAVRTRQPALYVPWMQRAAEAPRSFYGQVARRALGLDPGFGRTREAAEPGDAARIAAIPAGWRALALLQVGQRARAEAELRRLYSRAERNPDLLRALHQIASHAGLQHLAGQLAQRLPGAEPAAVAQAVPMPRLSPEGGFRIDPALLYAVTRQESNFEPTAISRAGARGLMQLMPETASLITNDPTLAGDAVDRLHEPGLSLELGQRYLLLLTRQEGVEGNLIRLLAAYNAGPGSVLRWQPATAHRDDPFLYIEAIPFDETRDFVRRVLSFSWAYAARLSLPAPSLDALAGGAFPRFASTQDILAMLQRSEAR